MNIILFISIVKSQCPLTVQLEFDASLVMRINHLYFWH